MPSPERSRGRDLANIALLAVFVAALVIVFASAGWGGVSTVIAVVGVAALIGLVVAHLRR